MGFMRLVVKMCMCEVKWRVCSVMCVDLVGKSAVGDESGEDSLLRGVSRLI